MDSTLSSRPMSKTGVTKINTTVQFPRGGRQIGTETGLSRSTSIERDPPSKKRHFFNFGKKKSHGGIRKTSNDSEFLLERKRSSGSSKKELRLKLDQNFEKMDEILVKDYSRQNSMTTSTTDDQESWLAPDSWAVQDDPVDFDDYRIDDQDGPKQTANIKIYRADQTYNTLNVSVHATALDILKKLAQKFFLSNTAKFNIVLRKYNQERKLGSHEKPLQIQKVLQDQMGYTDQDFIEDISYIVRFYLVPNLAHPAPEEKPVEHQVDISGRSFPIIPIYLFKYASQITSLDVSKNLHMDIPLDFLQICSNLTRFILANNDYGILPASLTSIHWLEHLDLSGNKIKNLVSLSTLILLQSLNVTNNLLSTIPTEFGQFQCLSRLSISNNTFTKFPMVVCDITSLTYLDISFNKITEFPHELGQLQNLQSLFAIANRITGILPDCFTQLMRLEELDVRQNMITDLDILSHLPKLERLLVDFNSISIVHCKIQALKTLKMYKNHITLFDFTSSDPNCLTELNLSNCKLSTLPDDLFTHTLGLEKLLLDCNTLNRLPISIGHLGRLVRMSIQSNNLESIPAEIGQLTQLKTLEAQKNNLKWIPEEIWLCESLLTLNCSSNLLETFPEPPLKGDKAPDSPVPNYNPPKYLVNPQNHSHKLRNLFLGDNLLTDDIWSPLSLFLDLRVLNLSFNYLYEIPAHGLCHEHLYELYLSGNQLTSLPADDIERLQYLRVLVVNGNKLQTLPAEIGKLRKLLVLDVGNNVLKYNIANWPYDWNWNWNLGLKYLNLSGNKRLEIQKKMQDYTMKHQDRDLSDFSALTRLRMLGLMDITILGVSTPEEYQDRRVRTTPSEVNGMSYGIADWLGSSDHLSTWDLVMPRYRSNQEESLFGLFDGLARTKTGCLLTKRLNDLLVSHFTRELNATKSDDTIVSAMRRVFLGMEQAIAMDPTVPKEAGASALVCYIAGHRMYVANVGDVQAVISRNNGQVFEITQKHIPLNPSEVSRVRSAGGYVTNSGKLNDALSVSRCFGQLEHVPSINCNPFVSTIDLAENDEFVILATRGLWDKMSYQTAVDIARTEKQDLMTAASKLRDFAISYGATENLMVMVIGVGDKFEKRTKRNRNMGRSNADEEALVVKSKRRGKEEMPGDSTLARLEREVLPPVNELALVFTDIKSSTQFWETQPDNMRSAIKIHDAIMRRTLRSVGGYEVKTEGDAFMVCFKNITAALLWCFTVQLQLLEADWPAGILDTDEGREIEKDNVVIYKGLSVRMGIHWGTPVFERNPITQRMDYFGPVVNKASRISSVADGGQICVSSDVIAALRNFPSMFDDEDSPPEDDDVSMSTTTTLVSPSVYESEGSFPVSRDLLQLKKLGFHVVELGERRLKGLETPECLSLVYSKQLMARIELDKCEMMNSPIPTAVPSTSSRLVSPQIGPTDVIQEGFSLLERKAPKTARTIDPNLVCALSNLAIRLERLTSGHALSQQTAGSSIQSQYTFGDPDIISTAPSGIGLMLDRHLREDATDEELVLMMENCVARVENATSSLYLQKLGTFTTVLEKLGEASQLDPSYIIRALQMYANS